MCRIHTTSYRSIRQIHSALQEIQSFTGRRLAGLTAKLVVRPEETAYFEVKENRKKSTTIWALSLEVDGDDMQKLVANLTENARVFAETRKLLGSGRVIEVVEDEEEQAPELTAEFYPPVPAAPAPGEPPGAAGIQASGAGSSRANGSVTETGHAQRNLPPISSKPATKPPLREPQRKAPQANGEDHSPATPGNAIPQQPASTGSKPNGTETPPGAQAKTSVLRGIVGPFEPDESGNTMRRNSSGVEYVVFQISQGNSAATVYCNRPEMLPEIARRQGRKVNAQVSLVGNNGQSYYVLDHFVEG